MVRKTHPTHCGWRVEYILYPHPSLCVNIKAILINTIDNFVCIWIKLLMSDLFKLSERLGALLLARGQWLAVAESCTGGWVAKCLTDVPGSSQWFDRGFVTYSNAAKQDMLGVTPATLQQHGAVSEATVAAMAAGVLAHSRAALALAVSGIAGPGGAVPGKPVGTVCFAWAGRQGTRRIETRRFAGDREQVRRAAVIHGITGLIELVGNTDA